MAEALSSAVDVGVVADPDARRVLRAIQQEAQSIVGSVFHKEENQTT